MTEPAAHVETARIPGRRLGKRPPSGKPALMLADVLTGIVPAHPVTAEHFSKVTDWNMLGNDTYGDCGPVSVANSRALTTKYLTGTEAYPTIDDVLDLYKRSGNPNFPSDDNGVDMQTMLEAVVSGGIAGTKAVAFAKVDHTNLDEIRAAIAIFGFVLFGVTLETAQQGQTDAQPPLWDYQPSSTWGGHAIIGGAYSSSATGQDLVIETWAQLVGVTDTFITKQADEVWVVIWPEHFGSTAFQAGVSAAALADAYKALTGKTLPVPVTPPVNPPQPPPPGPRAGFLVDVASVPGLAAKVDHARSLHKGSDPNGHMTTSEYTVALLASHLLGIHIG